MNTLGLFLPKHDIDINNKAQQIDDLKHWTDFTFRIILLLHVTPQLSDVADLLQEEVKIMSV